MEETNIEHVTNISTDHTTVRIDQLRELFPDAFTEGNVYFDKLRAALGNHRLKKQLKLRARSLIQMDISPSALIISG